MTPAHWVEIARSNQCREPFSAMITPISITEARFGSIPRAYIEATEDQVVPLAFQRSMQTLLPCDPVFSIKADHAPLSSAPEALAEHLVAIADTVDHHPEL
jgi:hypothetical protein